MQTRTLLSCLLLSLITARAAPLPQSEDLTVSVQAKVVGQNDGNEGAEDRGIIGMALDLLTGTPPEASPSPGGLVVHTGSGGQFHQAYPGTVPGFVGSGYAGYGGYGGYGGFGAKVGNNGGSTPSFRTSQDNPTAEKPAEQEPKSAAVLPKVSYSLSKLPGITLTET